MSTRITIREMSRAIVFAATQGKHTLNNYPDAMFVVDNLGRFFYRWRIEEMWADMVNEKTTPAATMAVILRSLKLMSLDNSLAGRVARSIEKIMQ